MAGRSASARIFEASRCAATHYPELIEARIKKTAKACAGCGKKAAADKTTQDSAQAGEDSGVVEDEEQKLNVKVKDHSIDQSQQEAMSMANTGDESSMSYAEQTKETLGV